MLEVSDTTDVIVESTRLHDTEFDTSSLPSSASSYTTTLVNALDTDAPVSGATFASSFTDAYAKSPAYAMSFTVIWPFV